MESFPIVILFTEGPEDSNAMSWIQNQTECLQRTSQKAAWETSEKLELW